MGLTGETLSIRHALELSNANPGVDSIGFNNLATFYEPRTIRLRNGELLVTDSVKIEGTGADRLTIDAGADSRAFLIDDSSDETEISVEISDLTITNGQAEQGGGILSRENLTLMRVEIAGNQATSEGGGIWSERGVIYLGDSTIANNAAERGAGLFLASESIIASNIVNSTVSSNVARLSGGGLLHVQGELNILGSTVTANGLGPIGQGGSGIASVAGLVNIGSSVLSGNGIGGDLVHIGTGTNPFVSLGFNLVGDVTSIPPTFDETGDLAGVLDPGLSPLGPHGGSTRDHVPLAGSMAIDNGFDFTGAAHDQRGSVFLRDDGGGMDVGSVERQSIVAVVDSFGDAGNGRREPGDLDFRDAIQIANENPGRDEVVVTIVVPISITLNRGQVTITDSVSIRGLGARRLTIRAGQDSRVFLIDDGDDGQPISVLIESMGLTGGNAPFGGAISNTELLVLNNVQVFDNNAEFGGGIHSVGELQLRNSSLLNNRAIEGGGAFLDTDLSGPQNLIVNTTISGNEAQRLGGGLFNSAGLTRIANTTITSNYTPTGRGSGLASNGDIMTRTEVESTIISGNVKNDVAFTPGTENSVFSAGHNLVGFGNSVVRNAFDNEDQVNVRDPLLGSLNENGGTTFSHLPQSDSPALNSGSNSRELINDQRGVFFPRDDGDGVDVGAVELSRLVVTVDQILDEDDGDLSPGDVSLREAIKRIKVSTNKGVTTNKGATNKGVKRIKVSRTNKGVKNE